MNVRTALAAFGVAAAMATPAAAQTHLDIVTFGGSSNLPIWVAQEKGFFAKQGLDIKQDITRGSVEEIKNLMAGKYQLGSTSFDNSIAYVEGQGDVTFDNYDLVGFMGVHSGMNKVVTRPEIKSYADVKGKAVATDALNSGYGMLLVAILGKYGLKPNVDYTAAAVGSGPNRLQAMKDNKAVIALVSPPEDTNAKAAGMNVVEDAIKALGKPYQGSAYVVRKAWAKDHEKELIAFIRAIVAAHDYIFTDKAGAVAVLKGHLKNLSNEEVDAVYTAMTSGDGGLNRKAEINIDGVRTLLALRSEYAEPKKTLTDPYKYVDLSYYEKAMKP
jgi:ABC-type nitrate/sulfonate/bicarbonate transport system substrate-binding protein